MTVGVPSQAIRGSIIEVMEGRAGSVRRVPTQAFGYASFDGQSESERAARIMMLAGPEKVRSVFDVQFKGLKSHKATPVSNLAPWRLDTLSIEILIWTPLRDETQQPMRDQQRQEIERSCDLALQALTYRGNVATTLEGATTNMVDGMLQGPDGEGRPAWQVLSEDWGKRLLNSVIRASAVLRIEQPTGTP